MSLTDSVGQASACPLRTSRMAFSAAGYATRRLDFRPSQTRPKSPAPSNSRDPGSGTAAAAILSQTTSEMLLVSSVTAPFRASALPSTISAPVVSVMLVSAIMFPRKSVPVPRVAELPICQNTLQQFEPLLVMTEELLAVVSVLPI